ncbi:hypothetical protein D3C72_2420920 [compost metagenome]
MPGLVAEVELVKDTVLSVVLPRAANRPATSEKFSPIALSSLVVSRLRLPSF